MEEGEFEELQELEGLEQMKDSEELEEWEELEELLNDEVYMVSTHFLYYLINGINNRTASRRIVKGNILNIFKH